MISPLRLSPTSTNQTNSPLPDGLVHLHLTSTGTVFPQPPPSPSSPEAPSPILYQVTTRQNHVLQPDVFGPRTWRHSLRIFHFRPNWRATLTFYVETFQCLLIPHIFWLLLLNGTFLGLYIYQTSTFAQILMAPPHRFTSIMLGYVQLVQVADCAILIPLLGYGADYLVKAMSRWRGGVFLCEYRLLPLVFPFVCGIVSAVIYGRGAADADGGWGWMAIVGPYHLGYFAFIGCNVISIAYCVDSFPRKAGPLLLVICAGRGFISFGLSYSTVPAIEALGYDGAMNVFAIVTGVLAALLVPAYVSGLWVRRFFARRVFREEVAQ